MVGNAGDRYRSNEDHATGRSQRQLSTAH
jgi:hypothetical protein